MANRTVQSRIVIRNDLAINWTNVNPVLLKGEFGIEVDTRKFKVGNGVKPWNELLYASATNLRLNNNDPTVSDVTDLGVMWLNITSGDVFLSVDNTPGEAVWKQFAMVADIEAANFGDMHKSLYATNSLSNIGYVDKARVADKWTNPMTLSFKGAATGSAQMDGSELTTINLVLANSGVAVGEYTKVKVGVDGRVTSGSQLTAEDVPNIPNTKVTGLGTTSTKDVGTLAGQIPILGTGGKLDTKVIPKVAISEVFVVPTEADMLALDAQTGDIAVRQDLQTTFMLQAEPATDLGNWVELQSPTDVVTSVNGKIGTIVLTTDDIGEAASLYYTEERATANFNQNWSTKRLADLVDGAHALLDTDTLILNGGVA